jgi:hypothetical protein
MKKDPGKMLKPKDFESLQALEKAIRSFIRYCNRTARPIHWTYTVEQLGQKLGAHERNRVLGALGFSHGKEEGVADFE